MSRSAMIAALERAERELMEVAIDLYQRRAHLVRREYVNDARSKIEQAIAAIKNGEVN